MLPTQLYIYTHNAYVMLSCIKPNLSNCSLNVYNETIIVVAAIFVVAVVATAVVVNHKSSGIDYLRM